MGNAIYRLDSVPNSGFQEWAAWAPSPELTITYPYQCIIHWSASDAADDIGFLCMSGNPIYLDAEDHLYLSGGYLVYYDVGAFDPEHTSWYYTSGGETVHSNTVYEYIEANNDIYTDISLTAVLFAKTVSGGENVFRRVRNVWHKGESFLRDKALRCKDTEWRRVNL